MVLVRDDLKRAARLLGLGLRQGERSYVMKALLAQDPDSTRKWLAGEAERWAVIHRFMPDQLEVIRDFWMLRAQTVLERIPA